MAESPQTFGVGGRFNVVASPAVIASAATIAPTAFITHISGTTQITTITLPWTDFQGELVLIPDAAFTTATGGNISLGSTAVANKALVMFYDGSKWNPSY